MNIAEIISYKQYELSAATEQELFLTYIEDFLLFVFLFCYTMCVWCSPAGADFVKG